MVCQCILGTIFVWYLSHEIPSKLSQTDPPPWYGLDPGPDKGHGAH